MSWILHKITTGVGITLSAAGVGTGIATTACAVMYGLPTAIIGVSVAAPLACGYDFLLGNGALTQFELNSQLDLMRKEHEKRAEQLKEAEEQIQEMKVQGEKRQAQLEQSASQIVALSDQVQKMETQNQAMTHENIRLANEIGKLGDLCNTLRTHELNLIDQDEKSKKQIVEQEEQIKKLWEIHAQLRLALKNLSVAGDTFNQFEGVLSQHAQTLSEKITKLEMTSVHMDETVAVLTDLTSSLQNHIKAKGLPFED